MDKEQFLQMLQSQQASGLALKLTVKPMVSPCPTLPFKADTWRKCRVRGEYQRAQL